MPDEIIDLMATRLLNESAMHAHALKCSKTYRAGKFTRVGSEFIDEVKADVEAILRELRAKAPTLHPALPMDENSSCTTGALCDKMLPIVNDLICRIIQNKVQRQPSVGKTLSRTR